MRGTNRMMMKLNTVVQFVWFLIFACPGKQQGGLIWAENYWQQVVT
jgi:hypothetical protein